MLESESQDVNQLILPETAKCFEFLPRRAVLCMQAWWKTRVRVAGTGYRVPCTGYREAGTG